MLKFALLFLAFAAVTGLLMAAQIYKGKMASWSISLSHAAFGAAGLVTVGTVAYQQGGSDTFKAALGLLLLAGLGGFFLASLHARKRLPPFVVVGVHAVLAVSGFLALGSVVLGL